MGDMVNLFGGNNALEWYKAGMMSLMKHWNAIDHHRHNKFLYLIRTCLRGCLKYMKTREKLWLKFEEAIKYFMDPPDLSADGAVLQLIGIYIEELGKSFGDIRETKYMCFLEPILFVSSF